MKYLHGFFAVYLVLPWGLWFCREVFGFVVKVVGHRTVCTWKPIIGGNTRSLFPLQFYKDDLKQFGVQALLFRPVSDHSFHGSERFCKLTPMKNWPSSRKAGLSGVFYRRMFFLSDFRWNLVVVCYINLTSLEPDRGQAIFRPRCEISHFFRKISSVSDLSREKVHTVSRNVPCSAAVRTSWSRISLY